MENNNLQNNKKLIQQIDDEIEFLKKVRLNERADHCTGNIESDRIMKLLELKVKSLNNNAINISVEDNT